MSLLLGTIIRKIPLPRDSESSDSDGIYSDVVTSMLGAMLDVRQLETIGNHFLEVLLKMKHNGAIDKTRAGFTALCNRLLCSNDRRYVFIYFICMLVLLKLCLQDNEKERITLYNYFVISTIS